MVFFLIGLSFLTIGITWHLCTKKYLNPYTLEFVFAKKGSGKSTYLTKKAQQYAKRGWVVYSTEVIPNTYKIDYEDIGYKQFKPNSVILIDEVGMIWHAREWKALPKEVRNWFKLQRHYKVKVIMASQSFDVDKSIRDLADSMWLLEKKLRVFTYGKRIKRRLTIIEAGQQSESRITDNMEFDSLFWWWCGSRSLTFIPRWTKYFDTFDAPALLPQEFQFIDPIDDNDSRFIENLLAWWLLVKVQVTVFLSRFRRS